MNNNPPKILKRAPPFPNKDIVGITGHQKVFKNFFKKFSDRTLYNELLEMKTQSKDEVVKRKLVSMNSSTQATNDQQTDDLKLVKLLKKPQKDSKEHYKLCKECSVCILYDKPIGDTGDKPNLQKLFEKNDPYRGDTISFKEISIIEEADADTFPQLFAQLIKDHNITEQQIFNAIETRLYWRCIPDMSMIHEKLRYEDRVSVLLCANAAGYKLPPLVTSVIELDSCNNLPVIYKNNYNSLVSEVIRLEWLDSFKKQVKYYFYDIGLPENSMIFLLLDNSPSSCNAEIFIDQNVVIIFPPYDNPIFALPLELGVVKNAKNLYRMKFMERLVDLNFISDFQSIVNAYTIKDFLNDFVYAWDNVSANLIKSCWSHILPDILYNKNNFKEKDFIEIFKNMTKDSEKLKNITEETWKEWLNIDEVNPLHKHDVNSDATPTTPAPTNDTNNEQNDETNKEIIKTENDTEVNQHTIIVQRNPPESKTDVKDEPSQLPVVISEEEINNTMLNIIEECNESHTSISPQQLNVGVVVEADTNDKVFTKSDVYKAFYINILENRKQDQEIHEKKLSLYNLKIQLLQKMMRD